jgi:dephospho-CoA kinase
MKLIGLTGGIGSGKSTIARRLEKLGARVIDADVVSREVVEPGQPALASIVATFGADVLNADGTLNRARLGDIVFTDKEAREKLNNIVHPAVRERSLKLFAEAEDQKVVIYDVPLLVESENSYSFEHIIVASAPEEIRVERLMEHRGMTESEARARIESQASEEARLTLADTVIDTSGSLEDTYSQVDRFWAEITSVD